MSEPHVPVPDPERGPTELTLEALVEAGKVEAVLLFEKPLSYREANLVRQAWKKGFAMGMERSERQRSL